MSPHTWVKKDVVERVVEATGIDPHLAAKTVDATFNALREMMTEGKDELRIEIRNFGVFEVKTKAKPAARNPKTNQVVYVPPRRKTHFKPGKLIKEALKTPLEAENE